MRRHCQCSKVNTDKRNFVKKNEEVYLCGSRYGPCHQLIMVLLSIHQDNKDNSGKKNDSFHLKGNHGVHSSHGKYSLKELDKFLGVHHLKGAHLKKKGPYMFSQDKVKSLSEGDVNLGDKYHHRPEYSGGGNGDGDIEMIDLDSEKDVTLVADYLSSERMHSSLPMGNSAQFQSYESKCETHPEVDICRCIAFVVDTNFIISHLNTLESIRTFHSGSHHVIIIPRYTIRELDGLKNSSKLVDESGTETIGKLARTANDWVYRNLASLDSGVVGQRVRQVLDPSCVKDDAILDCCLYFKEQMELFVILLSNDKNLCSKALSEDVPTVSYIKGMTGGLITQRAYDEYLLRYGSFPCSALKDERSEFSLPIMDSIQDVNSNHSGIFHPSDDILEFHSVSSHIFNEVQRLLLHSTISIMASEYGEDLEYIGFDPDKLKTLGDVSKCIYTYWISVFCEYFRDSKIRKDNWKSLPENLLEEPSDKFGLSTFIHFWSDILEHLYIKRSDEDNKDLEYQLMEWSRLSEKCN